MVVDYGPILPVVFHACFDISVYSAVQTVKLIFFDRFAIFISSCVSGLPPSSRHVAIASLHMDPLVHKKSEIFQKEKRKKTKRFYLAKFIKRAKSKVLIIPLLDQMFILMND